MVERGFAAASPWHGYGEWVTFQVRFDSDLEQALWLFRIAYEARRGEDAAALLERVSSAAAAQLAL